MKVKRTCFMATLAMLTFFGCSNNSNQSEEIEEASKNQVAISDNDWTSLFNGKSTEGWRGFNKEEIPAGWVVEDGTLKSLGKGGDIGGDIVYSSKAYEDFELYLEWKVSTAGNSGIFYHVQEGDKYKAPYENAPEYQLLDDLGYPDPLEDWQKLASDYAMYPAPNTKPIKPAGEWNTSRIIFTKERVQYFLNGEKVVDFVPWSDDWHERRKAGKWKDVEDYGQAKAGLIGLQDHGSFIWFKNIKIKEL